MAFKRETSEQNAVGMALTMGKTRTKRLHTIELKFFTLSFLMFRNYRIPRENLLNKHGDVLPDGTYKTPFKVLIDLDLTCSGENDLKLNHAMF